MRTILKIYQQHADDSLKRPMTQSVARRFLKWRRSGREQFSAGPMTLEVGLHAAAPTAGRSGAALG
jgi:hypothetical protein